MKVVSDGTVLAGLAWAGCFHVLKSLYGEVIVSSKVVDDLLSAVGGGWAEAQTARSEGWLRLRDPSDESRHKYLTNFQKAVLRPRQVETFLLALEEKAELVLTESIMLRGELGKHDIKAGDSIRVIAQAHVAGLISEKEAKKAVEKLGDYTFVNFQFMREQSI